MFHLVFDNLASWITHVGASFKKGWFVLDSSRIRQIPSTKRKVSCWALPYSQESQLRPKNPLFWTFWKRWELMVWWHKPRELGWKWWENQELWWKTVKIHENPHDSVTTEVGLYLALGFLHLSSGGAIAALDRGFKHRCLVWTFSRNRAAVKFSGELHNFATVSWRSFSRFFVVVFNFCFFTWSFFNHFLVFAFGFCHFFEFSWQFLAPIPDGVGAPVGSSLFAALDPRSSPGMATEMAWRGWNGVDERVRKSKSCWLL